MRGAMSQTQVAVIGAGPAGLTLALQLRRYAIPTLLFEGERVGGLLHNANLVENYPGFPGGISGCALVELFLKQATLLGVEVLPETVLRLDHDGQAFTIQSDKRLYRAPILALASGTRAVTFPEAFLPPAVRPRVVYEVLPLLDLAAAQIAIVGAGDAAFDYALNLAKRNRVWILNRGEQVKCLHLLWERAHANPRIAYLPNAHLAPPQPLPDGRLRLEWESADGNQTLEVDWLLGALGRTPRLELLSGLPDLQTLERRGVLHLIGDVCRGMYRQTAIAVGDGMLAAMKIYQYLKETG